MGDGLHTEKEGDFGSDLISNQVLDMKINKG
jgi:hypothetical protein